MFSIASLIAKMLLAATSPAVSGLTVENCEFGEAYAFNNVECPIGLNNESDKPIRVFDIVPSKPNDSSELREVNVAPHSHAYLPLHINVDNLSGYSNHAFRFRTNEPGEIQGRANVHGFVLSALDQPKPEIDFGVVDLDGKPTERSLDLSSHDAVNFHIIKLLEKPEWVATTILSNGHTVGVRIRADAPWGLHAGFIKLAINSPRQKQAWISVKADLHGDVVPASNPFNMGLLRVGNRNEFRIPLRSQMGNSFNIKKIDLEDVKGTTRITPCQPESDGCRWLELTISNEQSLGTIKGNVWVTFAEQNRKLQIALRGLIVEKDFKVKTIDQATLASTTTDKSEIPQLAVTRQSGVADLNRAIQNVVKQANEDVPSGTGPLLKWSVANGRTIYGFQIFRAESEEGSFVLQNTTTLASNAEDDASVSHQWRDSTAESGKTYWYYIGIVYNDGHKQQLTGPQKVVAK